MNEDVTKNNFYNSFLTKIKSQKKKIFLSIFIIFLIVIFLFYNNYKNQKENLIVSNNFNKAKIFIEQKNLEKSKEILLNIIKMKNRFYSPMALYLIIENKLLKDPSKISELFDEVLDISEIDNEDLNLIKIKKVVFLFNSISENEILELLQPISNSKSVWRSNAIKLLIDYYTFKGESLKAKEFKNLQLSFNN